MHVIISCGTSASRLTRRNTNCMAAARVLPPKTQVVLKKKDIKKQYIQKTNVTHTKWNTIRRKRNSKRVCKRMPANTASCWPHHGGVGSASGRRNKSEFRKIYCCHMVGAAAVAACCCCCCSDFHILIIKIFPDCVVFVVFTSMLLHTLIRHCVYGISLSRRWRESKKKQCFCISDNKENKKVKKTCCTLLPFLNAMFVEIIVVFVVVFRNHLRLTVVVATAIWCAIMIEIGGFKLIYMHTLTK